MRGNLQSARLLTVAAALAAATALPYAADQPGVDEVWPTKKVMDKAFLGKQSLQSVISKDLRKDEPDWKGDEKNLTEIIRLMGMLTKQKPPVGSQKAWDKLVQDYVVGAKVVLQNVKDHRLQPARAALGRLVTTCDECHDNHGIK